MRIEALHRSSRGTGTRGSSEPARLPGPRWHPWAAPGAVSPLPDPLRFARSMSERATRRAAPALLPPGPPGLVPRSSVQGTENYFFLLCSQKQSLFSNKYLFLPGAWASGVPQGSRLGMERSRASSTALPVLPPAITAQISPWGHKEPRESATGEWGHLALAALPSHAASFHTGAVQRSPRHVHPLKAPREAPYSAI